MQRVEVLDERAQVVAQRRQHGVVPGLQTVLEEIVAEHLEHRRQRSTCEQREHTVVMAEKDRRIHVPSQTRRHWSDVTMRCCDVTMRCCDVAILRCGRCCDVAMRYCDVTTQHRNIASQHGSIASSSEVGTRRSTTRIGSSTCFVRAVAVMVCTGGKTIKKNDRD